MIRGILFHGFLMVWTLLLGLVSMPLYAFPKILPWLQRLWSWGALMFLRLVGLRYRVQDPSGVLRKRPSPVLFVSRHHSAWETMAYIMLLTSKPTLRFVLKKELLSLPFFGWYLRRVGMIALNRRQGGEALRLLKTHVKKTIQSGHDIVIYPEGTRTDVGSPLILQRGVLVAYEAADVPVIPITLDSGRFWPKNSLKKYPGTITVRLHDIIPAGLPREVFWERLQETLSEGLPQRMA
ncbi:MAG: lysophospholipid acyltransferase family protein [bacterium]|jgi:1-acyl-sn-glycerol-3-phosphate acyltransferase